MALAYACSHLALFISHELIFHGLTRPGEETCLLRSSFDGTRLDAIGASG